MLNQAFYILISLSLVASSSEADARLDGLEQRMEKFECRLKELENKLGGSDYQDGEWNCY